MKQRIAIIEDCPDIQKFMSKALDSNYEIYCFYNGQDAIDYINKNEIDLIILDLMLPDMSGHEICRYLSGHQNTEGSPIMIVSGKRDVGSKLTAYGLGALNYLEKPFDIQIFKSIVKSLSNVQSKQKMQKIKLDGINIDFQKNEIEVDGSRHRLTLSEFRILTFLIDREGQTFSRAKLLEIVSRHKEDANERIVDTHISTLRKKIQNSGLEIKAIYREGYTLKKTS